jgi:hypothetical protein
MFVSWYGGGRIFRLLYSICVCFSSVGLLQVVILSAVVWGGLGLVKNVNLVSCCELINKNIYLCDGKPFILFVSTTNMMQRFKIMTEIIKSNLVFMHYVLESF